MIRSVSLTTQRCKRSKWKCYPFSFKAAGSDGLGSSGGGWCDVDPMRAEGGGRWGFCSQSCQLFSRVDGFESHDKLVVVHLVLVPHCETDG